MKKRIALLVVVLMVASTGCSNGNTPAQDPFFGRMTIAPPSTYMGTARSNTEISQPSRPIAAAPVSPSGASSDRSWSSPPAADFRSTATTAPGSTAETTTPGRAIHLSPSTIEDSLRTPSYTSTPTMPPTAWPNRTTTAASAPRTITPPPDLQAINGQPVREQNSISYRSANGTIPQYNDPRSSFGQTPNARFRNVSRSTTAPPWIPGQSNSNPERITASGHGRTQPLTVTPGTVASSDAREKMLPPIRGYEKSQRTVADTSTRKRVAYSAMTYRSQNTATSSQFPGVEGRPYRFVNLANLPDASRVASRPSRSTDGIKRLNYETPVDDRSDSSTTATKNTRVRPVSFTPTTCYSHTDDYTTLCGELEYSQAHQYWKLRYIPFDDEKMDDYGGSVILRDTTKLSGFERGDFVEVRGRLLSGPEGDVAYKRSYEVQNIRSIR